MSKQPEHFQRHCFNWLHSMQTLLAPSSPLSGSPLRKLQTFLSLSQSPLQLGEARYHSLGQRDASACLLGQMGGSPSSCLLRKRYAWTCVTILQPRREKSHRDVTPGTSEVLHQHGQPSNSSLLGMWENTPTNYYYLEFSITKKQYLF